MSDTAMDELFGMMKIAKTQQEAVQTALDMLAVERAALAKERAAVAQAAASVAGAAGEVREAAAEAISVIEEAVGASVRRSLAGASDAAAKALGEASRPVVMQLSGVLQSAGEAEASLKNASQWFAWKWVAVAAGGLVGVCLVAYAALAWQLHQVSSLRREKAALQASVEELEKRGGRIVMTTCGGRLCIEASNDQGGGGKSGVWKNKETGVQLVIPKGY